MARKRKDQKKTATKETLLPVMRPNAALAQRTGLPLATLDSDLRKAAAVAGAALVAFAP